MGGNPVISGSAMAVLLGMGCFIGAIYMPGLDWSSRILFGPVGIGLTFFGLRFSRG